MDIYDLLLLTACWISSLAVLTAIVRGPRYSTRPRRESTLKAFTRAYREETRRQERENEKFFRSLGLR